MINLFPCFKQNLKFEENLKLCQNTIQNTTIRMTLSLKVLQ